MTSTLKTRRYQVRQPASLPANVKFWIDVNTSFEEETRIIDVSRAGARLSVGREVEIGQPIHLSFAMTRLLRAFDKNEKLYNIWAIVRSVACSLSSETGMIRYEIGVAFVGQTPPEGYEEAPGKRYELKPTPDSLGLWQAREIRGRSLY